MFFPLLLCVCVFCSKDVFRYVVHVVFLKGKVWWGRVSFGRGSAVSSAWCSFFGLKILLDSKNVYSWPSYEGVLFSRILIFKGWVIFPKTFAKAG